MPPLARFLVLPTAVLSLGLAPSVSSAARTEGPVPVRAELTVGDDERAARVRAVRKGAARLH